MRLSSVLLITVAALLATCDATSSATKLEETTTSKLVSSDLVGDTPSRYLRGGETIEDEEERGFVNGLKNVQAIAKLKLTKDATIAGNIATFNRWEKANVEPAAIWKMLRLKPLKKNTDDPWRELTKKSTNPKYKFFLNYETFYNAVRGNKAI